MSGAGNMRFDVLKSLLVAAALLVSGSAFAQTATNPNSLGALSGSFYAFKFNFIGGVNGGACPANGCPSYSYQNVPGLMAGDIVIWEGTYNVALGATMTNTTTCLPFISSANALTCVTEPQNTPSWVEKIVVFRPTAPIAPGW